MRRPGPAEAASFSIRLTNAVTGEIVQEIPMTSSLSPAGSGKPDRKRQHSRFLHFHRLECSGRRSLYSIHHKRRQNSGQFSLPLFRKQEQPKVVSLKEFLLYRIWALFVLPATAPAANAAQDGADGPAPEPWLSPEELWQSIPELSPWEAVFSLTVRFMWQRMSAAG